MLNRQCIQSLTINSQPFISALTVGLASVGRSVAWRRLDGCLRRLASIIGNIDGFFQGFGLVVVVAGFRSFGRRSSDRGETTRAGPKRSRTRIYSPIRDRR